MLGHLSDDALSGIRHPKIDLAGPWQIHGARPTSMLYLQCNLSCLGRKQHKQLGAVLHTAWHGPVLHSV